MYFDIEDDPTRGITYLFGLLIKEDNAPLRYEYFLAKCPEEEEATVRAFWDYLSSGEVSQRNKRAARATIAATGQPNTPVRYSMGSQAGGATNCEADDCGARFGG